MDRDYKAQPLKKGERLPYKCLYELYINQNKSVKDLMKIFNTTKGIIDHNIKIHGIKKPRNLINKNIQKSNIIYNQEISYDAIYNIYITQNRSRIETANILGISKDVLQKYLHKYKIRKSAKERYKLIQQTTLDNYGVKNIFEKVDYIQEKTFKKLGVTNCGKLEKVNEKRKQTCNKVYGGNAPSCNEAVKAKMKNTNQTLYGGNAPMCNKEIQNKVRTTELERYGVCHHMKVPEICNKVFDTAIKRGTINKSIPEKKCLALLEAKFKHVETQYNKDKRYPYHCDFYIPELDLFIEYQGHASHGKHPFNVKSNNDLFIFNTWLKRSQEINFKGKKKNAYKGYLKVWILKDMLKRNTAKQNNLNWLEFFNMNDFLTWLNTQ